MVRTYSITCERKQKVALLHDVLQRAPEESSPSRVRESILLLRFRASECVRRWHDLASHSVRAQPTAHTVRREHLDRLPGDVATGTGRRDQHRRRRAVRAAQDPNVDVVGDSMGIEPYGVGVKKENEDLLRFVNGVLERMRGWNLGAPLCREAAGPRAVPDPPPARYQD